MTSVDTEADLRKLYADFAAAGLNPLWTQTGELMPTFPQPHAVAHVWHWGDVFPLAERAGELVPVGRGGERRVIALANPGLGGRPFATPTLWCALQYLGPKEVAPAHRHSQGAFRFILSGEGVWTLVDGDPVEMRAGDLLLTPSMAWHAHHNATDEAMCWIDGLDIPLVTQLDAGFFEQGPEVITDRSTPRTSRSERLWGHPGLQPIGQPARRNSPLAAYRWPETDAALRAQLELEQEGYSTTIEPGHAGVRYSNPQSGGDALVTMRTEVHRFVAGTRSQESRQVGSAVFVVYEGAGTIHIDGKQQSLTKGDLVAIPSWRKVRLEASTDLDVFTFSDAPVYESLALARSETII